MSSDKILNYNISFSFNIKIDTGYYSGDASVVKVEVTEKLPMNTDPHEYFKKRIAEELKRAFVTNGPVELKNKTENFKEDPLS